MAVKTIDQDLKVIYLDANFPFIDGFPLLPHLSHDDGEKIDLTFVYESPDGKITNSKKSISGYGVYENPHPGETDQTKLCKDNGHWFYDFSKYLTLGKINSDLEFSKTANTDFINKILQQKELVKLYIEPHLKKRLGLSHSKVRFHGCHAVRHDDHVHLQL